MRAIFGILIFMLGSQAQAVINPSCAQRLEAGQNRFHVPIAKAALDKLGWGIDRMKTRLSQERFVLLIDYSKNSKDKRAFLLDLKACDVVSQDYVIHGGTVYHPAQQNFGDVDGDGMLDVCEHADGSKKDMTRPGLYMTFGCHQTYQQGWTEVLRGCEGVKLAGLEQSNLDALRSGVVLHEHVSIPEDHSIKPAGQGCPAFAPNRLKQMMRYGMASGALVLVHAPQCEARTAYRNQIQSQIQIQSQSQQQSYRSTRTVQ